MSRPPAKTTGRFRSSDLGQLLKRLEAMGVKYDYTGAGHYRVHCPERFVIMSSTPSGGNRSMRNSISELRRAGLDL